MHKISLFPMIFVGLFMLAILLFSYTFPSKFQIKARTYFLCFCFLLSVLQMKIVVCHVDLNSGLLIAACDVDDGAIAFEVKSVRPNVKLISFPYPLQSTTFGSSQIHNKER